MSRKLLFFLSIILLSSCIEEIVYEQAQPEQTKNEKRFESKFRGKYYSEEGCYTFEIKKKEVIGSFRIETIIHKDNVPKFELDIKSDGKEKFNYTFKEKGDSVLVKGAYSETIFKIDNQQKLRYHDGAYFLNYRNTEEHGDSLELWHVKVLLLENNNLIMAHLPAEEDYLERIKDIIPLTPIQDKEDETIAYKGTPSIENWSRLIREKAYEVENIYTKKKVKSNCNKMNLSISK